MRLFGTDGVRGPFGVPPLDRDTVSRLGAALGAQLLDEEAAPTVLLGGDTRSSTPEICRWLAGGLSHGGIVPLYGGVLPTPAISRLVPLRGCTVGIAVSASHNPAPDNGIKLVDDRGFKWDTAKERALEDRLSTISAALSLPPVTLTPDASLVESYLETLASLVGTDRRLDGLRVTLDTANGAASGLAAELFDRLGAQVHSIGDAPDGDNINDGFGSTMPQAMAAATHRSSSHLGFAFDGDADRALLADETGAVRNGDAILFLLAVWMQSRGKLPQDKIVATTMSNLGLELALARHGIDVVRCDVGDRHVVETLQREGLLLGGEQSGHIVHLGHAPTGDGLLTAMLASRAFLDAGRPLSHILDEMPKVPQILRNVRVGRKPDLDSVPAVTEAAADVRERLGSSGRLVLRYSGTEPLCRIMIESTDGQLVEELTAELETVIQREIGEGG